ncbi:MAG: ATP-binding protein [Thermoguttaceae bacterium]
MTNSETQRIALRAAEVERRAEELERWKNEFLANVRHELRTPLNAILGYSRLLMSEPLPGQYHRQIAEIHGAGNVLLDLINNIIDFSKLSHGELRLSTVPFHVRGLVAELTEHYRPATDHKGLHLECHVPSSVPTFLQGDKHRYRQILGGLLSNAVKFTERGGIDIRLAIDEATDDQVTLRAVVTDTGVGIPPDRTEAVFKEFSQADGSTTRCFGGLGLGLAVAKRLVDLMGGQIGFRSVVGHGSSFWVAVPMAKYAPADELQFEPPADEYFSGSSNPPGGCGRPRILAVDGDATERVLIEAFLSQTGCLVDAVSSIDDAVAAVTGLAYDLAFIEVPAGGTDPIRRVRDVIRQQQRHTPILALAAAGDLCQPQLMLEAGASGLLSKPLDIPELIAAVQGYLPLAIDPLLDAERGVDMGHPFSGWEETESTWSEWIDEVRRAFALADYAGLEARTGALRRHALQQGSRDAADQAMRLQLAVRSGDGHKIRVALERLDRAVRGSGEGDRVRLTQLPTSQSREPSRC